MPYGPILTKAGINYFDAIQLISLSNLYNLKNNKPTSHEYDIGRICRYYSKKFSTALHVVQNELPLHHVLTAYFDDLFEGMEDDALEEAREDLLKTHEQRAKERDLADAEEVDIFELMKDTAKEAEAMTKKLAETMASGLKPLLSNKAEVPLGNPLLDTPKKMPDIKMKFIDTEKMNFLMEKDSLGLLDVP